MSDSNVQSTDPRSQSTHYRRLVAVFGGLLFLATYRLWIPQPSFPQVPVIGLLRDAPTWPLYIAILLICIGLVGLARPKAPTFWSLLFPLGWLLEFAWNQHALQPWAYQFVIVTTLFAVLREQQAMRFVRILAITIYFWSALSKFDYQFVHTVGSEMIVAMLSIIGVPGSETRHGVFATMAFGLPAVELIVAILLIQKKTRRWGTALAVAMHLALVFTLSPWGLGHEPSVILWNLFFACQAILLFWPPQTLEYPCERNVGKTNRVTRLQPMVFATYLAVLLLPSVERAGYWDHWPAWALYAPHSSRVRMEIPVGKIESLPAFLRPDIQDDAVPAWQWIEVPLAQASIQKLSAPIYPQARFQLGVAIAIAERANLQRDVRISIRHASNRWTGERKERQFVGVQAAKQYATSYWLNALPSTFDAMLRPAL